MAVDMFLDIKGEIGGEAQDAKHKGEIDVLAWSWGMSQSGTFHTGGGGGSGKVNVNNLSFTKWIDKSTPLLMLHCSNGEHIDEAVLTVRKAGGKEPLEYLILTMKKIMVVGVSTGGSGGEDRLTENVELNFAEVECSYTPQQDDGTADTAIDYAWDIEANKQA
jgi:type VI secretion system secreted protein Hcp